MPHRRTRTQKARRAHVARLAAAADGTPFSSEDLSAFQQKLIGTVVLPSSPDYDHDRQLSNAIFQAFPALIVYCQVFEDVWHSLAFARRHGLHVRCRSGGHSTAGFSIETGALILDTSRISYVAVDSVARTAKVGAGTSLGMLNAVLDGYRLHVPGGACPDVCVAGHMMGGGYGWTSRQYGMNCDNVIEVIVMLADGRTVRGNADTNPDLLWAVCGGTGNNFGVLLEITYQLHECWKVWGYGMSWPLAHAPKALEMLQRDYMLAAPPELGMQISWITTSGEKRLALRGVYHGSPDKGRSLVAPLLKLPAAVDEIDKVDTYCTLDEGLIDEPYTFPDVPDVAFEDKTSAYITGVPDLAGWKALADAFKRDTTGWAFLNLEVYGGAINARPPRSNAFMHRNTYADWVQDVFWIDDGQRAVAEAFLADSFKAWSPYFDGHANQDYPRLSQTDFRWLFWGDSFNTLLWIKQKYDPENFFHYRQSISPYPPGESPRDTSKPLFSDTTIVEEPYSRMIR
jgi:FAD/FMN-containing dehydrogenase